MRICPTRRSLIREVWRRIQKNPTFLKSIGSNYKFYGDEPRLDVDEFIKAYWQLDLRSLEETKNSWSKVHISCSLPKTCVLCRLSIHQGCWDTLYSSPNSVYQTTPYRKYLLFSIGVCFSPFQISSLFEAIPWPTTVFYFL